jgi:hypothetical protein
MVALWMISYEDELTRSAQICICEIFGRGVGSLLTQVGMGSHPLGDPAITDELPPNSLASAENIRRLVF